MEMNLDEVLYRDQRTFRTRLTTFRTSERAPQAGDESSISSVDDSSSSSLCSYCHNQYFNGNKRLCQCKETDDFKCRSKCEQRQKAWLKKFPHHLLLLSTCLTLLTFPCAGAIPIRIRAQSFLLRRLMSMESKGVFSTLTERKQSRFLDAAVDAALLSIKSASLSANMLKSTYMDLHNLSERSTFNSNQTSKFGSMTIPWLPKLPSKTSEEKAEYLNRLAEDEEFLKDELLKFDGHLGFLFEVLQEVLEQLKSGTREENLDCQECQYMHETKSLLKNFRSDLDVVFANANWQMEPQTFDIPEDLKNRLTDKSALSYRNFLVIRSVVEITEALKDILTYKKE